MKLVSKVGLNMTMSWLSSLKRKEDEEIFCATIIRCWTGINESGDTKDHFILFMANHS